MLLNEIANVTDISAAAEKRDAKKRSQERLAKMQARRQDKRDFKDPDEIGAKRRSKLSPADQFRDIARTLRNNIRS